MENDDCPYIFENGLRIVKPYRFTFNSYVKERWIGRFLVDHFVQEFVGGERSEIQASIREGRIKINDEKSHDNYVLKNGDNISHELIRRESPVIDQEIKILHMTDDLLIVNKPCSIPVHPTGRYNLNSMIKILEYNLGISGLACLNRIDLPVSGLVILTRNPGQVRGKMHDELHKKAIKKVYLAKVCGAVPWDEYTCQAPLKAAQAKVPLTTVDPDAGKLSETFFRKLSISEDGKFTLLECRPVTGRRHQIRVHLTHLGFPIYNDEQYMPESFLSEYPIVDNLSLGMRGICLHAFKYSGDGWSFEAPFPSWFDDPLACQKMLSPPPIIKVASAIPNEQ